MKALNLQDEMIKNTTVIIPFYNRSYSMARALDSILLNEKYVGEVLVIDDGSTLEQIQILNDLISLDKYSCLHVSVLNYDGNRNAAFARNFGIKRAGKKYVAFLDSDDAWKENKLEKQLSKIRNENDVSFSQIEICNGDRKVGIVPKHFNPDIPSYILNEDGHIQTSSLVLPAKLANDVLFDDSLSKFQDWNFAINLHNHKANFIYIEEPLSYYFIDGEDRIGKNLNMKLVNDFVRSVSHAVDSRTLDRFKAFSEIHVKIHDGEYIHSFFRLISPHNISMLGAKKSIRLMKFLLIRRIISYKEVFGNV